MSDEHKQHIIIIGGGVMGACSAYYLSKYDSCTVTLIEKTDIACAASGKSGGFLALDWNDTTEGLKELSRASYRLHQEIAEELDGSNTYGYRAMETYSVVFDTGENKSRVSSDHVDWINTHTVRSFEQIGTLKTTAQLHPELFTRKLIAEAKKTDRVKVLIGNGVTELLFEGDTVVGVVLSNGEELKGDQVVVCLGPWSGKLPLPNQPKIPVEGSHVHSIVLKPSQYIPNHALFTAILENSTTAEPEAYPRPDGTVYLCGALDKEPVPESASLVSVNPRLINSLIHQASCISTSLSVENNAEVLKRQACYLPLSSETSLPLIGPHTYYKELYLATGHSFWGILNAPITGKLISELLILNSVQSLDAEAYKYFLP